MADLYEQITPPQQRKAPSGTWKLMVLLAIGLPHEIAHGSLRLTLSHETTMEEIDYVVDSLKEIVARLREMSPLYEDFIKKQK